MSSKFDVDVKVDMKKFIWDEQVKRYLNPNSMADVFQYMTMGNLPREKPRGADILEEVLLKKSRANPLVEIAFFLLKSYLNTFPESETGVVCVVMEDMHCVDDKRVLNDTVASTFRGTWVRLSEQAQQIDITISGSVFELITKSNLYRYSISGLTHHFCDLLSSFINSDSAIISISNTTKRTDFSTAKKWSSNAIPVEDCELQIILEVGDYKIIFHPNQFKKVNEFFNLRLWYPQHWMNEVIIVRKNTQQKEGLMLFTGENLGIGVMPVRHKDLSSLMLGDDWSAEEKMMAEMAGYENEIWLDMPELSYIMTLRTTPSEMIEKWQQVVAFKL